MHPVQWYNSLVHHCSYQVADAHINTTTTTTTNNNNNNNNNIDEKELDGLDKLMKEALRDNGMPG